ncbi:MAG: hypothetical protein WDN44_08460 [Sphingomonas sp.]
MRAIAAPPQQHHRRQRQRKHHGGKMRPDLPCDPAPLGIAAHQRRRDAAEQHDRGEGEEALVQIGR